MASPEKTAVKMEPSATNALVHCDDGSAQRVKYKEALFRIGIAEITIGALSVLLAVIAVAIAATTDYSMPFFPWSYYSYFEYVNDSRTFAAMGLWGGLVLVGAGVLWILKARKDPTIVNYKISLALAIAGAVLLFISIVISLVTAAELQYRRQNLQTVHVIIVVVDLVGLAVCIIHFLACGAALGMFSNKYIDAILNFFHSVFSACGLSPAKGTERQQRTATVEPSAPQQTSLETGQSSGYPAESQQAAVDVPALPLEKRPADAVHEEQDYSRAPESPPSYEASQKNDQQQ